MTSSVTELLCSPNISAFEVANLRLGAEILLEPLGILTPVVGRGGIC